MPFHRYLEVLAEQARGVGLPSPQHVPSTFLFAFDGPRIVGRASIRHRLNAFLEREGGHIGYVVVPEFRRRGHAVEILRQAIAIGREKSGARRLLATCDDDNVGSIQTIERVDAAADEERIVGRNRREHRRRAGRQVAVMHGPPVSGGRLCTLTRIFHERYIRRVETVFEIIAEPNRRAILGLLVSAEQSVGDIERRLQIPQPTVSKHLRVLREAGFVESTVDAQRRLYRLRPEPLQELDAWLAPFRRLWSTHLDALERHLDRMGDPPPARRRSRRRP
jgi:predicted acetyltransferase/DNA-binding transcriptional ArsR family regulator